jgi:sugar-specific transcriptional regulator TrmB
MALRIDEQLTSLGFSRYEIACYLALVANHPINGSQLSRYSGVARSKVYDVLLNLEARGLVGKVGDGKYVPLPPEELIKRLRLQFETNVSLLREQMKRLTDQADHEHIWLVKGYKQIMNKAQDMISTSREEIYIRLFPQEGVLLDRELHNAEKRGVAIRYVSLGPSPSNFAVQVLHPDSDKIHNKLGGRAIDLVVDRSEALTGSLEEDQEDDCSVNWTRNKWFITASRDSLRHDFYHFLFFKLYERNEPLSEAEKAIYRLIKEEE